MSVEYKKKSVQLIDDVSVDDAEALLQWLQVNPKATINLSRCTHVHAAVLQVLMAAGMTVTSWPQDSQLDGWLRPALQVAD